MKPLLATTYMYEYTSHTGVLVRTTGEYMGRVPASRKTILRHIRENIGSLSWTNPRLLWIGATTETRWIHKP